MKKTFSVLFIVGFFILSGPCVNAQKLVDPLASKETKNLFFNLMKLKNKGIMFGHQDDLAYGVGWKYVPGKSDVKEVTGDYPAVYGFELGRLELDHKVNIDSVPFDSMRNYIRTIYKRGGVITLSWHLNNPLTGKTAWDSAPGTVASILPGGEKNDLYKSWLDKVADFITNLKDENSVLIPVILIAFRSFLSIESSGSGWRSLFFTLGDPVVALVIGILLAFAAKPSLKKTEPFAGKSTWRKAELSSLLQDSAEKAGGILVIIGAGGAFGAVLAATHLGEQMSASMPLGRLGIFFPFLLTFVLKTAQGSSTVAIITAASIIHPLLPALGLNTANGQLLCVLSMGAGSMMISHANDAYFWVVAKFSGLDMRTMLRVYTVGSVIMGLVSLLMVFILKLTVDG